MLTRRLFLAGAVAAPAIVRAESLMKLWVPPERKVWVGVDFGSGDETRIWVIEPRDINPETLRTAKRIQDEVDRVCGLDYFIPDSERQWQGPARPASGLSMLMGSSQRVLREWERRHREMAQDLVRDLQKRLPG